MQRPDLSQAKTDDTRSHQKIKKKASLTKINGTRVLKFLAAFCVLNNVGVAAAESSAPPTAPPTCGCSDEVAALQEEIEALKVEGNATVEALRTLRHEFYEQLQDVRQCSNCVSPSPPPPSPPPPPPPPPSLPPPSPPPPSPPPSPPPPLPPPPSPPPPSPPPLSPPPPSHKCAPPRLRGARAGGTRVPPPSALRLNGVRVGVRVWGSGEYKG